MTKMKKRLFICLNNVILFLAMVSGLSAAEGYIENNLMKFGLDGGWYMDDSIYIKSLNGKHIYSEVDLSLGFITLGPFITSTDVTINGTLYCTGNVIASGNNVDLGPMAIFGNNFETWLQHQDSPVYGIKQLSSAPGQTLINITSAGDPDTNYIALSLDNQDKVKFYADGRMGIGLSTPPNYSGLETVNSVSVGKEVASGVQYGPKVFFSGTQPNNNSDWIWMRKRRDSLDACHLETAIGDDPSDDPSGSVDFLKIGFTSAGTFYPQHVLRSDGNITHPSDIRFKRDINQIENALSIVLQLNPVIFSWKSDEAKSKHYGLIAQELEAVIPHLVRTHPGKQGFKGIHYDGLYAYLLEAQKEQLAILDEQEKQIDELYKEFNDLKNKL
ncbi:tail fiber domain-containing protein [Thermoproteota archaeon]